MYSKKFLTIDGHKLAYIEAGNPSLPTVLLVHGWLSHGNVWRETIDALCATHHCIAVDLLGMADSDKPADADYSVPAHARRVLQVADALKLDRFTLIGHSLGGQISFYIASVLAPERVVKVVSVAGVVTGRLGWYAERIFLPRMWMALPFPSLWKISRALVVRFPNVMTKMEFGTWFYDMNCMPHEAWEEDRRLGMQSEMHISAYRTGRGIRQTDLSPHLSKINVPTLIIFGRQDTTVPTAQGIFANDRINGSQIKLIDKCGHFPMYEHPRVYIEAVKSFV